MVVVEQEDEVVLILAVKKVLIAVMAEMLAFAEDEKIVEGKAQNVGTVALGDVKHRMCGCGEAACGELGYDCADRRYGVARGSSVG